MEDAVLHPRDFYVTSRGSFSTGPVETGSVTYGVKCPGKWRPLRGRCGAHTLDAPLDFDLSEDSCNRTREIKCQEHGVKIRYKTYVERNHRGPPHTVRFIGSVPAGTGFSNKKVRIRVEYPGSQAQQSFSE